MYDACAHTHAHACTWSLGLSRTLTVQSPRDGICSVEIAKHICMKNTHIYTYTTSHTCMHLHIHIHHVIHTCMH